MYIQHLEYKENLGKEFKKFKKKKETLKVKQTENKMKDGHLKNQNNLYLRSRHETIKTIMKTCIQLVKIKFVTSR